ncbi:hypothetical protein [Mucilaginibacter agri]|uniref:Uncharacterized protein n=1 Tax=Mucilaginibacter agri TaxID=2695265 RepID=A0A965ZC41_9SPHI|nr:hypothetical protein [Mucilaginibacter agri]NCD68025.1 hypothetical protein [Mucilaginibacter agri]
MFVQLDAYPFKDFGYLNGTLIKVSDNPANDSLYVGLIAFDSQFETSINFHLKVTSGMMGQGIAILSNKSLMQKLLSSVR